MRKFWCFFRSDAIKESCYVQAWDARDALFKYIGRHRYYTNKEVGCVGWQWDGRRTEVVWATI